ncbi:Nicotinamidase-related amidase [Parafrankia irregularis]|uniref:Nicotinamidase-related amidase n=2 Tax=Frankiaceae TaxID=74712 RepID=A0A0S4QXQ1_9ACTN|nr:MULTISPECIES: isochorismatase family protein [Parafrankia]CUU60317.1 Nicotinamidase-related amidase [Parafrankia irregularis]
MEAESDPGAGAGAALAELDRLRARFAASGMVGRVGWGEAPAVVVVDLIRGFTDPASPLGGDLGDVVEATGVLVATARRVGVPVYWAEVAYAPDMSDAGVWPRKISAQRLLVEGGEWTGLDTRLTRRPGEPRVVKKHASAFLGTDLADRLRRDGVDTILVAGCTTSGCVRATVVDGCGLGFRPIVVREAVGDRSALVHEVSLFDLDAKYGDVEDLAGVLDTLTAGTRDRGAA